MIKPALQKYNLSISNIKDNRFLPLAYFPKELEIPNKERHLSSLWEIDNSYL